MKLQQTKLWARQTQNLSLTIKYSPLESQMRQKVILIIRMLQARMSPLPSRLLSPLLITLQTFSSMPNTLLVMLLARQATPQFKMLSLQLLLR